MHIYFIAIAAGLAYYFTSRLIWGYLAMHNFVFDFLIENILPWNKIVFYGLIYVFDLVINIALAYPFALIFLRLPNSKRWQLLGGIVLVLFIYEYRLVFSDLDLLRFFLGSPQALAGMLTMIGILPLTVWLASTQRDTNKRNQ